MSKRVWLMFLVGMTLMSSLVAGEAIASSGAGKVKPLNTKKWQKYDVGRIRFHDKAPQSEGSKIYHRLIAEPETYISEQARTVLATLYFSPKDSITPVRSIYYTLEDKEGISAKGGGNGRVHIFYSTRHVESSHRGRGDEKVMFETRGVLLHELTHAYQLEPRVSARMVPTVFSGHLSRVWPMLCVLPTAVSTARRIAPREEII